MHPRLVAALRAQLRSRDPGARRVGWKIAGLEPGDRILAGSVVQVPVAPGERVVAAIDGLSRAEAVVAGERQLRR